MRSVSKPRGKTPSLALLGKLLRLLVEEWGYEAVVDSLAANKVSLSEPQSGDRRTIDGSDAPSRKLTARDLALKADMPEERRDKILWFADRYDAKVFLPASADVRNFLEVRGEPKFAEVKNRADAFRRILRLLSRMPDNELDRLSTEPGHYGPSSLAPLSEAIRSASEGIRAHSESK